MKKHLLLFAALVLLTIAGYAQSFGFTKPNENARRPHNGAALNAGISEYAMPMPAHLWQNSKAPAPQGNALPLPAGASKGRTAYGVIYSPDAHAGYWMWDVDDILGKSLIKPGQTVVPLPEGEFPALTGADFVDGKVYGYTGIGDVTFYVADALSGDIITSNVVPSMNGFLITDMAYDHSSETMYVIINNFVCTVSMTDGALLSNVALRPAQGSQSFGTMMTVAIDLDGNMYCISDASEGNTSYFYSVNKTTGVATSIGPTGKSTLYNQSMGFDHYTGTLYWCQMTVNDDVNFMTVSTTTGEATQVQPISWEVTAFFVPYYNVDAGAPAQITDLTVTPGASGALTAQLLWTNPALTFGGETLTELTSIKVYENSAAEPIHTLLNPAIGGAETFNTTVAAPGSYRYRVVATNSLGEMATVAVKYIGIDRPAAPTGVVLERNGMTASLSWTAPSAGLNGYFFSNEGLVYDVYRMPYDNVKVADGITETTFSEILEEPSVYLYKVVARNAAGVGGEAESNYIFFCPPHTVFPWTLGFEADESFGCIEQVYVSGNTGWQMAEASTGTPATAHGGSLKAYFRTYTSGSKTKMVMPAMDLTGVTLPVLEFWHAQPSLAGVFQDKLRVYYRTSSEGEWTLLQEYTEEAADWTRHTIVLPNPSATYYIAFEGESQNARGIQLDDVVIKAAEGVSLSGIVDNGTAPVEGATVAIAGTDLFATTAANGSYEIAQITAGTHTVETTMHGYQTNSEQITFDAVNNVTHNITLTPMPSFTVSGKVTSVSAPGGVAGVAIALSGYENYTAATDAAGNYAIPNVYGGFTYDIKVQQLGYHPYSTTVEVGSDNAVHSIALSEIAYPVIGQEAVISNIGAVVSWNAPVSVQADTIRYDDGSAEDAVSMPPNTAYWIGNRFETEEPGIITGIELYGMHNSETGSSARTLTIDIFNEAQQLVATSEPFQMPGNAWITVPLNNVLYSGTFYAMVHWQAAEGHTHFLGMDASAPNGISMTYSGTAWHTLAEAGGGNGVCMMRASVNVIESVKLITPAPTGYTVYRLEEGQPETSWALLATVTETTHTDTGWSALPAGTYQYAIKANYAGNSTSAAALTNVLNRVFYTVALSVAPENGGNVEGAGEYAEGASATVTATPEASYEFVNWTENGAEVSDETEYEFDVTANRTLVANFAIRQFTVTYEQPANGTLTVTAGGEPIASGSKVDCNAQLTITATPAEGYALDVLTVNGAVFVSGNTYTAVADVEIVCTFKDNSGISGNTLTGITVYGSGNNVYIVNKNNIPLKSVQIADVLGRIVYRRDAVHHVSTAEVIPVNGASGIYVVRIVSDDNKVLSTKVQLN